MGQRDCEGGATICADRLETIHSWTQARLAGPMLKGLGFAMDACAVSLVASHYTRVLYRVAIW
jgi:hypothetical protein